MNRNTRLRQTGDEFLDIADALDTGNRRAKGRGVPEIDVQPSGCLSLMDCC